MVSANSAESHAVIFIKLKYLSLVEHNNDQIGVKTKQLAWRMTAQPYNGFVLMLWSWHLPCNGNHVTIITIIGLTIVVLFYTLY